MMVIMIIMVVVTLVVVVNMEMSFILYIFICLLISNSTLICYGVTLRCSTPLFETEACTRCGHKAIFSHHKIFRPQLQLRQ
jgi:hypothetical protein